MDFDMWDISWVVVDGGWLRRLLVVVIRFVNTLDNIVAYNVHIPRDKHQSNRDKYHILLCPRDVVVARRRVLLQKNP
jgi:hypothetical protein